jgi:hypothetical protein
MGSAEDCISPTGEFKQTPARTNLLGRCGTRSVHEWPFFTHPAAAVASEATKNKPLPRDDALSLSNGLPGLTC